MPKSAEQKAYEKKLAYNNEYNKSTYRSFSVRFNREDEKKIIKWIEKKKSVKAYIKDLILKDMESQKTTKKSKK